MDPLFATAGAVLPAYEAVDWASTPLGPTEDWSPTLRLAVAMVLETHFPVTLLWGPEAVLVYNEPYTRLIGDKHPMALGRPTREVFPEAWPQIEPLLRSAIDGDSVYLEDTSMPLVRQGFLEECFFTFCYSPVRARNGAVEGVIDIASETTAQVLGRRRLDLLGRLGAELATLESSDDVLVASVRLLRAESADLVGADLRGVESSVPADPRLPAEPRTPLGEREVMLDFHESRPVAWLPLHPASDPVVDGDKGPLLVVEPDPLLLLDDELLVFLRLIAGTIGQALDRVEALALERRAAAAEREMFEALQHSLLGGPVAVDGAQVAVRYQPAQHLAQIGGDWHDSFLLADGVTAVVVGDVAGHDRDAAAGMAQVKNLLRGIAYSVEPDPAVVLTALDRAMLGLDVGTLATAVLAVVERTDDGHRLRWSNAGHPPPLLLCPDGQAQLLDGEPELMLGVERDSGRTTRTADLPAGGTVLLFTDGLVERRVGDLDDGLAWIVEAATGRHDLHPEDLCDHLLARALPGADDDVALVAVRVGHADADADAG